MGHRAHKRQNVISRIEDPNYGKFSLQTLLEIAAALDLPLWVDIPEWEDWFRFIENVPSGKITRRSFDVERLAEQAKSSKPHSTEATTTGNVVSIFGKPSEIARPNQKQMEDFRDYPIKAVALT